MLMKNSKKKESYVNEKFQRKYVLCGIYTWRQVLFNVCKEMSTRVLTTLGETGQGPESTLQDGRGIRERLQGLYNDVQSSGIRHVTTEVLCNTTIRNLTSDALCKTIVRNVTTKDGLQSPTQATVLNVNLLLD